MASARVELKNVAAVQRALRGAQRACDDMSGAESEAARIITRRARSSAPRRTGQLAASITARGGTAVASASYAGYVEFGTRHTAAQPYWVPAVHAAEPAYERVFNRELERIARQAERVTA